MSLFREYRISFFLFLFLSIVSGVLIFTTNGIRSDNGLFSLFFISILISIIGFLSRPCLIGLSLNKIFFLFNFLFLGIAPVIQYKYDLTFYKAPKMNDIIYFELIYIIILVQIVYAIFYFLFVRKLELKFPKFNFESNDSKYLIFISLISLLIFLYLVRFNIEVLFVKPPFQWLKMNTKHGLIGYSILLIVRTIPVIAFLAFKLSSVKSYTKEFFLLMMALLASFPTSLPRATVVSLFLPILILYFFRFFKRNHFFTISFLLGFLVVFPLLNFFRRFDANEIDFGLNLFKSGHMDAFHNFAQLYSEKIITNGWQFLGSALFFIPESIWINRPVGTGRMLAELNNYSYSNITMPFLGEGYVNFGYLGIFIFTLILATLNSFMDANSGKVHKNHLFSLFFLFFIGFEFYFLRGDLYSSFKKFYYFLAAVLVVVFFVRLLRGSSVLLK